MQLNMYLHPAELLSNCGITAVVCFMLVLKVLCVRRVLRNFSGDINNTFVISICFNVKNDL
jgi:hypothetical protein